MTLPRQLLLLCTLGLAISRVPAQDDWLDQVDEALTFSSSDGEIRARLSGMFDVEAYHFTTPAPGLIFTDDSALLNPRLSLFLDAQLGPHLYLFVQSRLDRGFDPSDAAADMRLDEYAVRWTPWNDGRFNLQVGKFGTVVGNWMPRHLSWDNPFINGPLVYENMTAIYDAEVPESAQAFLEGIVDAKYDYNPVIWGPSYAAGIAISGALASFDYAFEMKNAALSSRPETWNPSHLDFDHPTWSGRLGYRPNQAWNLGFSASQGAYFIDDAEDSLPKDKTMGDYKEIVLGQDISFAWHHWQLWAEVYEARFQVPYVGDADSLGYYVEAKYKFTPQCFGALRWNQQVFDTVTDSKGSAMTWGHDLWRIDAAIGYRFTAHTQLKLQYSLHREESTSTETGQLMAAQFTVRF